MLVFVEPGEDVEKLSLADLRNQFDHFVEDDGSLLSDLGRLVLRDRVVHRHELLLRRWCHVRVDAREQLNCCELRSEAFTLHESLDHTHDCPLEVSNSNHGEDFLNALSCLCVIKSEVSRCLIFINADLRSLTTILTLSLTVVSSLAQSFSNGRKTCSAY